jgi:hypothetical protein
MVEHGKEEAARGRADARDSSPRIFTHGGGRFAKCGKMGKGYGELLEMSFSLFSQKTWMGKGYAKLLEMLLAMLRTWYPSCILITMISQIQ